MSEAADTLIVYAFSGSDGWREDNLLFWLARGLVSNSRYHFVVIVNGHIDDAWRRLLDRVAASLANFEWHQRPDAGRDVCAWRSVLSGSTRLLRPLVSFVRFVLINASCRGPFLPSYFRRPWPEVFLSALNHAVALSGVTFHCDCQKPAQTKECRSGPDLHIQSYLLAFGARTLPTVLELQAQACEGSDSKGAWWFEKALTRTVLADGSNVAVTQGVWARVDFRDAALVRYVCAVEANPSGTDGDPMNQGQNAGMDMHPAEAVFFKTNSGVSASTLRRYTRNALINLPWAVSKDILCG
jgi:hypothetical protein